MEQTTQESGSTKQSKTCEEEANEEEGAEIGQRLGVEVDGSNATAEAALSGGNLDGQDLEVALVKDGDQWKLDEVADFTKFDQTKLIEVLEAGISPTRL